MEFHIPHVQIMDTNNCGDSFQTTFKRRESFQDVLYCRDYAERVVASFSNQIKSEYYGGNKSVSIEDITLKHFSELPQTEIKSSTETCPQHAVFCSFLSDDIKQDSATTTVHSNRFIELLKKNLCQH